MDRKKFITTTGLLGLSTAFGSSLFGQKKKQNPVKEKIILKDEGKQINCLGDHQVIKLTAKDTNGQFAKIYLDNPPYTQVPLHVHGNEDEVFNVIEGEVEFTVGGKTTLLKSGDAIFLPRNKPHTWKVVGTTNAKVHLDVFPAGLENMFEELSKLTKEPSDLPKVAAICERYKVRFV
ncbi:MAG TPA: cupin domain-containing protein [Cyclobacteriaceae bacterium]|jgi:quercetin dioxygenase-like cupin family protein|nr:cupin domain-containing protein [Cyclobacteriaceae bacterium]